MHQRFWTIGLWSVFVAVSWSARAQGEDSLELVETRRIWDGAPHSAFTDLIRFQDRWFCVFREGKSHVSPDGAMRVLTSSDAIEWQSAALITSSNSDLRDAKICVAPGGTLMLCGAEALHDRTEKSHQSLVWFSPDGTNWSDRHDVGDPNCWLWRVTWLDRRAYGIGYGCGPEDEFVRLYSSEDGIHFDVVVDRLLEEGYANESSIVFEGETAYCLLRRDPSRRPKNLANGNLRDSKLGDIDPNVGLLGVAKPPYREWSWQSVGARVGGPHMILMPDGRLLAAVRLYDPPVRTSLCWIDKTTGQLSEALPLPSGGDTSYAGLVLFENHLWVSYYSSHEGKSNIYLAKVALPTF